VVLGGDDAEDSCRDGRAPVPTVFAFHQYELDVVLDYRVWLIRLAEKRAAVLHLIGGVRDLVPDDRSEVVEANLPAVLLD